MAMGHMYYCVHYSTPFCPINCPAYKRTPDIGKDPSTNSSFGLVQEKGVSFPDRYYIIYETQIGIYKFIC